jgi:GNAT superfamily N-acetyltransferase
MNGKCAQNLESCAMVMEEVPFVAGKVGLQPGFPSLRRMLLNGDTNSSLGDMYVAPILSYKSEGMIKNSSSHVQILPIAEEYIAGFHQCLNSVARERLYLGLIESPGLDAVRESIRSNIARDLPQFVAVEGNTVVGWCDISPQKLQGFTHCGRLGMGVLKNFRGKGIGKRLVAATLDKARAKKLERVEL